MLGVRELFRKYANPQIRAHVQDAIKEFIGPEPLNTAGFNNLEQLDFRKLSGRLLSYSVIPLPGELRHKEMMRELKQLFEAYQRNGIADFHLETKIYWGRV